MKNNMSIEQEKTNIENWKNSRMVDRTKEAQLAYLSASSEVQNLCEYLFNQGVQNGLDHSAPSKKTMEELSNIKVNQARQEEKVDFIKESLVSHIGKEEETFQRLEKIVADFMISTNDRFAGKWLETLVVRLGWIIITPIIGGAIYGIYMLFTHVIKS
jgi:hypothetical protein